MRDILKETWMVEMIRTLTNMYNHGWDERNGGNVSMLLDEEQVAECLDLGKVIRTIPTGFPVPELAYFKNVQYAPEVNLGIVRLTAAGDEAELLWGFTDGGQFTSEFPAHMMSHAARLQVNPESRVYMHCHPTNLLAMTYVHELDERAFTRTLWQMCTECIVVYPDGVNILPCVVCGTNQLGLDTAEKMKTARLVIWSQHGLSGMGNTLDEAFGLIETVEKAAEVYMKIAGLPRVNTISDEILRGLAERFGLTPREGYLD